MIIHKKDIFTRENVKIYKRLYFTCENIEYYLITSVSPLTFLNPLRIFKRYKRLKAQKMWILFA